MKIILDLTILLDKEKTGIGQYAYQLTQGLSEKLGKDVLKFLIAPLHFNKQKWQKETKLNPPFCFLPMPQRLSKNMTSFWQKLGWPKIEVFTGKGLYHSFDKFFLPCRNGIATIFDLTPLLFPSWYKKEKVKNFKTRLKAIKNYSKAVICCSQNSKIDLTKYTSIKKDKVFVVYPGVNRVFFSKKSPLKTLKKWGIRKDFLLMVGVDNPRKNLKNVLQGFLFFKKKTQTKTQLVLVGRKNEKTKVLIKETKNPDIISLAYIREEELANLYRVAHVLLYPSFYEGFGIPTIEAMASSCPVITSRNSSLTEAAGEAALYVNPHKPLEIAKAIYEIKNKTVLRNFLIQKGKIQAKKFSWKKSVEKTIRIYKKINQKS